ncbi:DNA-directed DNA polymerase [Aureococcus anophagefferens]|nr:DNA-directed DNA polymerase [Aureococcus anophagefferens]
MHFGKKGSVFGEVADCGAASFMGICRLDSLPHRRIDVKVYAPQHYACALLYFTGSDHFNRSMRWARRRTAAEIADNKVAVGRPVEFEREEDVFAFLELPYKTPPERALDDNAAGIAAAARSGPRRNVDVDDDDDAGAGLRRAAAALAVVRRQVGPRADVARTPARRLNVDVVGLGVNA